ncbi:MAG TPA: hypothetical protein VGJ33_02715 [Candidatus Angelobacter sp.]
MQRRIVLTAGLIVFSAIFAQCQTSNQSPVPAPSTVPVVSNEPFGGPIISTPTATFYTPPPTAGISDAGRAGISSENTSIIPPGAAIVSTGGTMTGTTPSGISSTEPVSPAESVETGPANDLGPSVFVGEKPVGTAGGVSLAEISRRFKAEKGAQTERVLSNEDVQKMLSQNGGVTMAKNMPPLGAGPLEQSGQQPNAGSQPASSKPMPQNNQNASTNQPGTSAQTGTQSQSGANQNQPALGASANNATTPQIQNQQANDAQGSGRLPATATFLPLIGLLGLASGAIGLLFRKFRK